VPVAKARCAWARPPASIAYHDREWGTPVHDDRTLFEFLILEGAQAGLSWETILAKRERYREVFANFEMRRVAKFGASEIERLMLDPGIVRNRLKITATIDNARAALALQKEFSSLATYFWGFVDGKPIVRPRSELEEIPTTIPLAHELSKDLKNRGFRFVGPTIMYAFMQATGMVDDHLVTCFRATKRS